MPDQLDMNDNAAVTAFVASLRSDGYSLVIIDPLSSHVRGSQALIAAADNVVDLRGGQVSFLKRRHD